MALCRWSTSSWYIYEPCGSKYHLEVCTFGQFSVVDILRYYHKIDKKAAEYEYNIIERLELAAYLKLWALWRMKKVQWKTYVKLLNYLRLYGEVCIYCKDAYSPFFERKGIPEKLQAKPSFSKALQERVKKDKRTPLEELL